MLDIPASWIEWLVAAIANGPWFEETFLTHPDNVRGLLATLLVCFICGAMGSQVVGNRMAFFSDALAHCAFAGVGLGLLMSFAAGTEGVPDEVIQQRITLIMVVFGIIVGLLIAFVREKTGLASDTVIGVFFAGSVGLGAVFTRMVAGLGRRFFNVEDFIFGNPTSVRPEEVVVLIGLAIVNAIFLCTMYNWMIMASASPSLALSRQVPVTLSRYLLIVLLALLVNLSQQIVGALLINGLLIVPAATAANLARNLRQMFWYSIFIALAAGGLGYWLSWEVSCAYFGRFTVGTSGSIVVISVIFFIISAIIGRFARRA
jgi:zinc transport system permease protein